MAQVDAGERQVTLKVVYFGPPQSGKTTNLRRLFERVEERNRGRLLTLETKDDRTIFFDLLPIFFRDSKFSCRIKVYTVPGQPMHEATRRVVLRGVDGVAFVADSHTLARESNLQSYDNLVGNLQRLSLDIDSLALVTQYNKRDLDDRLPQSEMVAFRDEAVFGASALNGEGVVETFLALVEATWSRLDDDLQLSSKFKLSKDEFSTKLRAQLSPGPGE